MDDQPASSPIGLRLEGRVDLASDASTYVTGQTLAVDGGWI